MVKANKEPKICPYLDRHRYCVFKLARGHVHNRINCSHMKNTGECELYLEWLAKYKKSQRTHQNASDHALMRYLRGGRK